MIIQFFKKIMMVQMIRIIKNNDLFIYNNDNDNNSKTPQQ